MTAINSILADLPISPVQLSVGLAVVALTYLFQRLTRYPSGLPPGPKPTLFNGNRALIPRERPWLKLAEIGLKYPAGFYTIWTGPRPTIVITSAKVAADLLDKRSNIYSSRPRFVVAGELMSGVCNPLSGRRRDPSLTKLLRRWKLDSVPAVR